MTAAYWKQWDKEEEEEDYQYDNHNENQEDGESEGEYSCCASGCMNCLDISYRDFL